MFFGRRNWTNQEPAARRVWRSQRANHGQISLENVVFNAPRHLIFLNNLFGDLTKLVKIIRQLYHHFTELGDFGSLYRVGRFLHHRPATLFSQSQDVFPESERFPRVRTFSQSFPRVRTFSQSQNVFPESERFPRVSSLTFSQNPNVFTWNWYQIIPFEKYRCFF